MTLTVPSAGTFVLTSTVHVWIDHTTGTTDQWVVHQTNLATDCSTSSTNRVTYYSEVPGSWPTDTLINLAGSLVNTVTVSGAGTYTFYLNVHMAAGEDAGDRVSEAMTVVVFYPG